MDITEKLSKEFGVGKKFLEPTITLIDEGNTIPFIARYRKEVTGGMTDVILRDLSERLSYLRGLEERKAEVIKSIEEQGKLTEEIKKDIEAAEILQRVEDLYKPFKQKKSTRASKAREKGLEPLSAVFLAQEAESGSIEDAAASFVNEQVETPADAIAGACDIIAEQISDDPDNNEMIRDFTRKTGVLESVKGEPDEGAIYEMYYEYTEPVAKIPNHRVLALNRGEKEKKLKVYLRTDADRINEMLSEKVITNEKSIFKDILINTVSDAYKRLMAPSIEREIRNELTERAQEDALKVFSKNTESLLMQPPVKNARVLAIDPGYRTGCKVAALADTGKLLAYATIYPTEPKNDIEGSEKIITKLIEKCDLNTVVIGNGTASRETEKFVADYIAKSDRQLRYTIVSEAGASVYSASKLASEEYPDLDVTTRGAMSIGRRLQDPLAELVKVPPRSMGVGQYQHDINQGRLDTVLTNVVEDCVNRVGVDLNTASPSLLSYISGVNSAIAKNIVAYRDENGAFTDRKQLLKVPKLGKKTYEQCAGFMRISGGKNPLDATAVHPESYAAAEAMLSSLEIDKNTIASGGGSDIEERIKNAYPAKGGLKNSIKKMAEELDIGELTLSDIVQEIKKPARDPRESMPPPIFRQDVLSFEDLEPGMEMEGSVRNVVDFGAFVDIGVKTDGLVHISQLSNRYVKHPMDVVSVGDIVKVKILSVDKDRHKISLTMLV